MPKNNVTYPEGSDLSPNQYLGLLVLSQNPWVDRDIAKIETEYWQDDNSIAGWWITWGDDVD